MIEFIKKYRNYIIIIAVVLLVAGVFVVKQLTSKENNEEVKHDLTMYNFGMVGCGACKDVEPVYNKIKEKYKEEINFKEVDVNKNTNLAIKYGVQYTPTFVIVNKDGKALDGFVGLRTEEQFKQLIDSARSKK